jgi:hypothetical protein
MTRDEAKAIVDGGTKYLSTTGVNGETVTLSSSVASGFEGWHAYVLARENGAGGNLYTTNVFDEAWDLFIASGSPISQVDYYRRGR